MPRRAFFGVVGVSKLDKILNFVSQIVLTIQKIFLIWISRSFKKGASDNTISYLDKSSPSGSLASDLFWPEIWWDLVKISRGEQRENKYFFNFEQCATTTMYLNYVCYISFGVLRKCFFLLPTLSISKQTCTMCWKDKKKCCFLVNY